MTYGVIYKITNLVNSKIYIGQTVLKPPIKRWRCHRATARAGSDELLSRAIRKHGEHAFKFETVLHTSNKEDLNASEARLIEQLGTASPLGYNLQLGGAARRHSDETKKRMSEKAKLAFSDPLRRAKHSLSATKAWAKPEVRDAHQRAIENEDARARHKVASKAGRSKPDVVERQRLGVTAAWKRAEVKAKRRFTDNDPIVKKRRSDATKAAMARPEVRRKLAEWHGRNKPEFKGVVGTGG